MGDLFDYANNKAPENGTEVRKTNVTTPEVNAEPFEGKSYTFRTQRYKAEDRPCIVNENNRVIPLDSYLANAIVNSVSRTASLYSDVVGLEEQVKYAVGRVMPTITDGVIPAGTVTVDNLDEAKKMRTELNKLWTNLESERKSGKSIIEKPYDYINDIYKEKTRLLTTVIADLKSQIDRVEGEEAEKKKNYVRETILKKAADYNKDLPELLQKYDGLFNKVWQDSFLNKTMTDTKMQSEIMSSLASIADDLKTIEGEKDPDELKISYFKTGDLSLSIRERQQIAESKALIEKLKAQSAPKPTALTAEPISISREEEVDAPPRAPQKTQVTLTDYGPGKDQYFHCWNANPKEFDGLIVYMKEHGFRCEGIKKIVDYYKTLN